MADIFISYSKMHAGLTEALARDLEAEGYTTWWDTNLLPDDGFFPQRIRDEIRAAQAVIVIWAEHSVTSRWVHSEATEADEQGKLLQLREDALDPKLVPLPFKVGNVTPVRDLAKLFAALARKRIAPSNHESADRGETGGAARAGAERERAAQEAKDREERRRREAEAQAKAEAQRQQAAREAQEREERWRHEAEAAKRAAADPRTAPVTFRVGPKDERREVDGYEGEGPRHKVTIPHPFAVGRYAVTFDEWDAALAAGGVQHKPSDSGWGRGRRPVINVSWSDAQAYVKWPP